MKRNLSFRIPLAMMNFAFSGIVPALLIVLFSVGAHATIVQTTTRTMNNGVADFGSGDHSFGGPSGPATITYDWDTSTGVFRSTGRVRGTLYWDSLWGGGCARLTIRFRDSTNSVIQTRRIDECGPGGDANNSQNRTAVDQSFTSSGNFAEIALTVSEFKDGVEINPLGIVIVQVSELRFPFTIENGPADFGNGYHSRGEPTGSAFVTFRRNNNGTVTGGVDGVLYKDALFETFGCATLEVTYRNTNGGILDVLTEEPGNCGPGGNANDPDNMLFVSDAFSSGSLFQVRVLVDFTAFGVQPKIARFNFGGRF